MDLLLPPRKMLHATTLKAGQRTQKSDTQKSDNLRSSPEHGLLFWFSQRGAMRDLLKMGGQLRWIKPEGPRFGF